MTTEQEIRGRIKSFRPTSQKVDFFDPNLNEQSTRLFKFKNGKEYRYRLRLFTNRIKLETPLATSLLFSINIPDKVCLADRLLEESTGIGKIFTDNSNDEQIAECITLLNDDLRYLNLTAEEGLTVYNNWLQLTLATDRTINLEVEMCQRIKSTIELNFPEAKDKICYLDAPTNLRGLLHEFSQFAISDDFEREEKIETLTTKQRNKFIAEMEPRLDEINNFLDSFKEVPLTDGAIKLQTLAELFTELTIGVEKKNHS
jgi:hypothetical protein